MSENDKATETDVLNALARAYPMVRDAMGPELVEATREMFARLVCPAEDLSEAGTLMLSLAYTDWVVFDLDPDGWTMLEKVALGTGEGLDAHDRSLLGQVVATQRLSEFAVIRARPGDAEVDLVDLCDGKAVTVRDSDLASLLARAEPYSTITARVAEVDGRWFKVGRFAAHDRRVVDPGQVGEVERPGLIPLTWALIGDRGLYAESAQITVRDRGEDLGDGRHAGQPPEGRADDSEEER